MFDSLTVARRLTDAGMNRELADATDRARPFVPTVEAEPLCLGLKIRALKPWRSPSSAWMRSKQGCAKFATAP